MSREAPEMTLTEWQHPRHGRIHEVVCRRHGSDLLRALHTLGIGSTGRTTTVVRCGRCAAEEAGQEPRFFLGLAGSLDADPPSPAGVQKEGTE